MSVIFFSRSSSCFYGLFICYFPIFPLTLPANAKNKNTMKRFNLKLVGLLAVCTFSFGGYTQMNHSKKMNDLLLENVEALAAGEEGTSGICIGHGSIVCPLTKEEVEHVYIYSLPH